MIISHIKVLYSNQQEKMKIIPQSVLFYFFNYFYKTMKCKSGRDSGDHLGSKFLVSQSRKLGLMLVIWAAESRKTTYCRTDAKSRLPDSYPSAFMLHYVAPQNQILVQSSYLIILQHCIKYKVELRPCFAALRYSLQLGLQAHCRIFSPKYKL